MILITSRGHAGKASDLVDKCLDQAELSLNEKSRQISINGGHEETNRNAFDFLGYEYGIRPRKNKFCELTIDIAEKKARKIKTRIAKSVVSHLGVHDEQLLYDRIRALSSNYRIPGDFERSAPKVGIYYSYPLVTKNAIEKGRLKDIDGFLRALFIGQRTRLSRKIRNGISDACRRRIMRLSFVAGHRFRIMANFSETRVSEIKECWRYE